MDIVQKFIKASLKEANRSDMSVAYNSNISKSERLAIILAKNLNGKILKKDKVDFLLQFDLPQNYSLKVDSDLRGQIFLGEKNIFYWRNLSFVKGQNIIDLTDIAKNYDDEYGIPADVSFAALKLATKIVSIKEEFYKQDLPDENSYNHRKSARDRRNLEKYKKDQAYYRNLFIKSGAISEEDLAKYLISIEATECGEPDWDLDLDYSGSAKFDSKITFSFRDRTTKALYKFVYNVSFTVGVDGWYSPGNYWDPPEEDTWLTGDIYNGEVEADLLDVKVDGPSNGELEDHLADIIDDFAKSGMLAQYINDNLEDITGYDIK